MTKADEELLRVIDEARASSVEMLSRASKALEGKLKRPSGSPALDARVLALVSAEEKRLSQEAEKSVAKLNRRREKLDSDREKWREERKVDRERLELEKAHAAREAEQHELYMVAARRELGFS